MTVSIILPTYCEAGNIAALIQAIQSNLCSNEEGLEIVVVDDASPDGTAALVNEIASTSSCSVRCLERTQERGLATAILCGIRNSTGDKILVMDTDFNHDPGNLAVMIGGLSEADLVVGSRFVKGGGMEARLRNFFSYNYNLFLRLLLRLPVHDNLCGFFCLRRRDLERFDLPMIFQGYGEYFIRLVTCVQRSGLKIKEVPAFYKLRPTGESKSHFGSMLRDYTKCTLEMRNYRPGKQKTA